MTGKYNITVSNNKLQYKFTINRNITVIKGNSATGKTTLIEMIALSRHVTSIQLKCDVPCIVIGNTDFWESNIENSHNSILFFDENCDYVSTHKFASLVKNSDCYFVIVTRNDLHNLPYSVNEIYEMVESKHYGSLRKTFNSLVPVYGGLDMFAKSDIIITEDSNSGYQFFNNTLCNNTVISANGKDKITKMIEHITGDAMVLADGAAFGANINDCLEVLFNSEFKVNLYLPESFEWLILRSKLFYNKIKDQITNTSDYVESSKFMSWEQYFTSLLVELTKDTKQSYNKSNLNPYYLSEHAKKEILDVLYKDSDNLDSMQIFQEDLC